MTKQNELRFQKHIIDCYAKHGGHASKWASEWQASKPDLICSLPSVGMHLHEVKHLPNFGRPGSKSINQLTPLQRIECRNYLEAGGKVWALVIGMASDALGSGAALFNTQDDHWFADTVDWVMYRRGEGFDIKRLMEGL